MLRIPAIVEQTLGQRFPAARATVIRIETTRPVYLAFYGGRSPDLAVRFGSHSELSRSHAVLSTLHDGSSSLVPQSLLLRQWDGERWLHIQAGMPGIPWFALRPLVRTAADWARITTTAVTTLERFRDTVARTPEWVASIAPAGELRRIAQDVTAMQALSGTVQSAIAAQCERLTDCGSVQWTWQHGDYCLNNLLIDGCSATVIDFEEFGASRAPLHDEFSLALSLHALAPSPLNRLDHHLVSSVTPTLRRFPRLTPYLEGLFLLHLLTRIAQCAVKPQRRAVTQWLTELVETHCADGCAALQPVRSAVNGEVTR